MASRNKKSPDSKKLVPQKKPITEVRAVAEEHKVFRAEITEIKTFLQHFSGPLPPPEAFAKYDQTLTGAADRILTMAEKQQGNRLEMQNKILKSDIINEKLGLLFGFLIALSAIGGGVYCAHIGQTWAAVAIGGGGVAGLVAAFVQGTRARKPKKSNNNK